MSVDDTGQKPGGQAVTVDDEVDESNVPTAPMRAVPPQERPQRPPVEFDDEDDDGPPGVRPGSTDNPFTETHHAEIPLKAGDAERIEALMAQRKPSMGKVLVRLVVILAVLGGIAFGTMKVIRPAG